jgi:4-amino-4-deoxy-L-arabinose transferase-like glycosyltransferase
MAEAVPLPASHEASSRRSVAGRGALPAALLAVAFLAIPYLGFLGSHQLWQPYEPDLVETAREMRARGDFMVPRLNGEIYSEKPPLYYWSALGAAAVSGRLDEATARLPSALYALTLVLVTAAFGARLFGARAGLLAGLVLGTTPLAFQCGTAGMCDMPLALATTLGFVALYLGTAEGRPRGAAIIVAGACVGVSVLAKSLVGPVLVFAGAVSAIAADRERRLPALRYWALAAIACAVVALPWYVAVWYREGWAFLFDGLLRQTFGRFFGNGDSRGSIVYYLRSVPVDLLPWTIFLPLAVLHARRVRAADPERWRKLRFLLIGAGAELAFLSASSCRINKYALPVFPLLALWIGASLDGAKDELERRLVAVPAVGFAIAMLAFAVALPVVVFHRFTALVDVALLGAALAIPGAVALYIVARTAAPRTIVLTLAALLVGFGTFAGSVVFPAIGEIRGDRPLEGAITGFIGADTPFASYFLGVRSYLNFYTERNYVQIGSREGLDRWLASLGARPAYILTKRAYFEKGLLADATLAPRLRVVGCNPEGVGHDDYVLVRIAP